MSTASRTECLRSVIATERSTECKRYETESPVFPPVSSLSSVARSADAELKGDIADLVRSVPALDMFSITEKIGSGTFSSVYLAHLKNRSESQQRFALKHLIPTSHPSRIENELRCLKDLRGQSNIIAVKACVRHNDHVVIIMPYFQHDRFQDYVQDLSLDEIREYMRALVAAVAHVHRWKIIHRDIKHSNFLYNRRLKQYALVDFGLAQRVSESESNAADSGAISPHRSYYSSAAKQRSPTAKVSVSVDENLHKTVPCQSADVNNTDSTDMFVSPEKVSRSLLQTRDSNVQLTRLDGSQEPSKKMSGTGSGGRVSHTMVRFPLRRELLMKRALSTARQQVSLTDDASTRMNKSKRQSDMMSSRPRCRCFGRAMVCSICLSRPTEKAPRAGTPGYRAPEVLMKCPHQTTAVDVWSVGVIFLSLLAGHYPIFKASDDMEALSQIVCIFGSEELQTAAKSYGKQLDCSPASPAMDLKQLCIGLRHRPRSVCPAADIPDSAVDLLHRLLDLNPFTRITAADALNHPFLADS